MVGCKDRRCDNTTERIDKLFVENLVKDSTDHPLWSRIIMIYDWLSTTTTDEESLWFMIDYHLDKGIKKWGNQDSLFDNPSVLIIKKTLNLQIKSYYRPSPKIKQHNSTNLK